MIADLYEGFESYVLTPIVDQISQSNLIEVANGAKFQVEFDSKDARLKHDRPAMVANYSNPVILTSPTQTYFYLKANNQTESVAHKFTAQTIVAKIDQTTASCDFLLD